jgi:hypothetical protein
MKLKRIFAIVLLFTIVACTVSLIKIKGNEEKVNVGGEVETKVDSISTNLKEGL